MLQALIFDSFYDKHRGVIAYIRIFKGEIKTNQQLHFLATNFKTVCQEVGVFKPNMVATKSLASGEVGYIVTGLKELDKVNVGDTVCDSYDITQALPGYKQVEPKVFASIFTVAQDEYPKLRDSITKLKMNDASLYFEPENIPALGFGFRCGFLGLLHLDIVKERLEREYNIDIIVTTPSVEYKVKLNKQGEIKTVEQELSGFERFKMELVKSMTIDDLSNII
jgi:GTP-binding protein LepA